jgi:hypothetical protein
MPPHRSAAGAQLQCDLGVPKNGAENVVELMRDAAGERANRFQLLRLMQPGIPVAKRDGVGL